MKNSTQDMMCHIHYLSMFYTQVVVFYNALIYVQMVVAGSIIPELQNRVTHYDVTNRVLKY